MEAGTAGFANPFALFGGAGLRGFMDSAGIVCQILDKLCLPCYNVAVKRRYQYIYAAERMFSAMNFVLTLALRLTVLAESARPASLCADVF